MRLPAPGSVSRAKRGPTRAERTLIMKRNLIAAGYDAFQISDNTGALVGNPSNHSQVQAVGGQIGLTYVPWDLVLNFHGFYE